MSNDAPLVSVIIPAWHSAATIATTLRALEHQSFLRFEVIVVNSSPGDGTDRVIASFPGVRRITAPSRLLMHATRNRGAELARGELLVFTDPDCELSPDWLEILWERYRKGRQVVVGSLGTRSHGWLESGSRLSGFRPLLPGLPAGAAWIAPTANAACSRRVWDAIGSFDGSLVCGDALQSWKAAARFPVYFEPRAVVCHINRLSLGELLCQRVSRGMELGATRIAHEGWGRGKCLGRLLTLLGIPWLVTARAGRSALRAGWLAAFLATLIIQFAGHAA